MYILPTVSTYLIFWAFFPESNKDLNRATDFSVLNESIQL